MVFVNVKVNVIKRLFLIAVFHTFCIDIIIYFDNYCHKAGQSKQLHLDTSPWQFKRSG